MGQCCTIRNKLVTSVTYHNVAMDGVELGAIRNNRAQSKTFQNLLQEQMVLH